MILESHVCNQLVIILRAFSCSHKAQPPKLAPFIVCHWGVGVWLFTVQASNALDTLMAQCPCITCACKLCSRNLVDS